MDFLLSSILAILLGTSEILPHVPEKITKANSVAELTINILKKVYEKNEGGLKRLFKKIRIKF